MMNDDETQAKTDPAPAMRRLFIVSWTTDTRNAVRVVVLARDHEEAVVIASGPDVLGPFNRIAGLFSEPCVREWPEDADFALAFDLANGDESVTSYRSHEDVAREIKRGGR